MTPDDSGTSGAHDPDRTLRRIEKRVQRVQGLDAFHFSQREDGRFQCALEKPLRELSTAELHEALSAMESLSDVLREELERSGRD